jgi:hypothetical protein
VWRHCCCVDATLGGARERRANPNNGKQQQTTTIKGTQPMPLSLIGKMRSIFKKLVRVQTQKSQNNST